MKYRARANGEIRELTPREAAALVPGIYVPVSEERATEPGTPVPPPQRDPALTTLEASLLTASLAPSQGTRRTRRVR